MQKRVKPIIDKISTELGLPVDVVKAIIESQFQCAREATKQGEAGKPSSFFNIRFKHLGLLVAKPSKILKIHENARSNINQSLDR